MNCASPPAQERGVTSPGDAALDLVAELNRMKVLFQQRAIITAMGFNPDHDWTPKP